MSRLWIRCAHHKKPRPPNFGAIRRHYRPNLNRGLRRIEGLTPDTFRQYLQDMSAINLKVNGKVHAVDVDPTTPLLYVLSDDLALNGPKFGCGLGQCGACTVIVKGQAIRSCVTPVKSVEGAEITTLEGIGTIDKPHPLQAAFIEEQAAQCGFCINGVIMTAKAFLDKNPKATEQEIHQAMSGVLCRCFTHVRMLRAINRVREGRAPEGRSKEVAAK
jgi:nicotinate dehydrogenase subunit A